jgi:hypothetical protein
MMAFHADEIGNPAHVKIFSPAFQALPAGLPAESMAGRFVFFALMRLITFFTGAITDILLKYF